MTIKEKYPFDLKFLLKLQVLKIRYEPHCESIWWVRYKDYDIKLEEEYFRTTEEDEIFTKEVKARIYLMDYEMSRAIEKKKVLICGPGCGMTATGIFTDIIETESAGDVDISYKLDSVFSIVINDLPAGAKIGDWITVSGEGRLILPRARNEESDREQLCDFLGEFFSIRDGLSDDEVVVKYVTSRRTQAIQNVLKKGGEFLKRDMRPEDNKMMYDYLNKTWIEDALLYRKWLAHMLHNVEEEAKKQGKL